MSSYRACERYRDEKSPNFLVEYRGNFKEQIDKVTYACGDIITNTLAVLSVAYEDLDALRKDVPSIKFIELRSVYVLQDIIVTDVDNINEIKLNPYLNLNGKGVIVGMIDSGIDFLNKEFIREDDTSRILSIWDQTAVSNDTEKGLYMGSEYGNSEINKAIKAYINKEDPYKIVPSKDEVGHGTNMAGIIGGRGYNKSLEGVASDCDFVVVKLFESTTYKKVLKDNGIVGVTVYSNVEVLAGIEYLRRYAEKVNRPMVIYIGVGSTSGSHAGDNMMTRYLNILTSIRGLAIVSGVGNEGDSEGHASGYVESVGGISSVELSIPRDIKQLSFDVWVKRPDIMSISIISPYGESSNFIEAKVERVEDIKFILTNSSVEIKYNVPETFTGEEVINLTFTDMKPGIWKLQLKGNYITTGRYDIWLPPKKTLPEGTKFLMPDPFTTLTIPSTAKKIISVSYYNSNTNAIVSSAGKGYNAFGIVKPDISTAGINVLTTSNSGETNKVSGSSVATAIVAGCCCLIFQWGIVDKNDISMYSTKIRSYLMYGADRQSIYKYPNKDLGYGILNILKSFNVIGGIYRSNENMEFIEYYVGKLYVRVPSSLKVRGEENE